MVPEGWSDATLGDLVRLQRGHDLPAHSRADGDIEVIGGGGPNGYHNEAKAPAPGIVIGRSGSGIGNAWWTDKPFWPLNTGMYVTDFLGNDPRFCFLWLDWIDFTSHNSGGAQPSLNRNFIYPIPLPIPPIPEQRKIADILSTWDRAIETTEALLATARTQKRALMQSLLTGKRRFPELERQEWKEVRLGDMGQVISGGTPDSTVPEYWDGDVQWATPTDITKLTSRFITGTARQITARGLKSSAAKLLPAGAILICTRATIGELAIATGPICTNQGFKNLVPSDEYDSDFVFYLLQFFKNELIRYACGSTFLELSKKDFEKRAFRIPGLVEQKRIAAVLNAAEEEIAEHRESIEKLRSEKKALMQQLLTGKRRVVVE